jgi:hypothetical protein
MGKWREEFVCSEWLSIYEDLSYKKIINCKTVMELKCILKYLFEVGSKWENKVSKV